MKTLEQIMILDLLSFIPENGYLAYNYRDYLRILRNFWTSKNIYIS